MSASEFRHVHSTLDAETSTACRIDEIGYRDVHTMHDTET